MSKQSESLRAHRPARATKKYLREMKGMATVFQERATSSTKPVRDPTAAGADRFGTVLVPQTDEERRNWSELLEAARVEVAWAREQLGL